MSKEHKSIAAYDPGLITGCAVLDFRNEWSFSELSKNSFQADCDPFTCYAICETSSGNDGLLSAYMRGYIEGRAQYDVWVEQPPAARRKFIPMAEALTNIWFKKYNNPKSDHIIDACAHLLAYLYKNDRERYEKIVKEVR